MHAAAAAPDTTASSASSIPTHMTIHCLEDLLRGPAAGIDLAGLHARLESIGAPIAPPRPQPARQNPPRSPRAHSSLPAIPQESDLSLDSDRAADHDDHGRSRSYGQSYGGRAGGFGDSPVSPVAPLLSAQPAAAGCVDQHRFVSAPDLHVDTGAAHRIARSASNVSARSARGSQTIDQRVSPAAAEMLPDIPRLSSYTKSVQGALASAIATAPRPAGPARSDPPQPHGVAGISSTALNDSISPLADVSLRMVELGLPPVPQSLINSSPTADTGAAPPSLSPVTLRAPQADDLVKYLFKLAGEIAHRDRTIEAVKNRLIQTDAAASASREKLAAELDEARAEAESLRRQAEAAASQRQSDRREVDSLRFRLKELQAQQESAAQRDLRSLARFKQKYSQPYMQTAAADGSDAVMLEIIRAYELKIDTLQKQIDSQQPSGPASTTQSAQLQQQQQQKPSLQSSNSNELEAQLANTIKSLEDAKRQNEALKLELTNTSKNGWIHDAAREQMMSQMSTRDLIRRDKKLWRTKLAYIDTLSREQACELLKDICIKLSIRQITQIPLCVERIRVVMRLVGQMEAFIREVDTIVTAHTAGTSDARAPDAPHKLSHLVGVIRSWAENAADAADLKAFSNRVHNELQIQRREGVSPLLCLERLRLLVRASAQSKPQTAEQQAQSTDFFVQFCQLYKVETHKEALTAMNNMFILQQEVESGLDRLRQALGADVKVQPIRLLVNAAEVLEKMHAEAHKSREYALGDGLVTPSDGGASRARTHSNLAQQHKRADRAYGAGVEEQLGEYERGKGEPAADARAADRWSGLARAGVTQADAVPTLASAGVSRLSGVGRPTGRVGAVVGGLSMLLGKTVLEDDDNVLADTSIDRSVSHSE